MRFVLVALVSSLALLAAAGAASASSASPAEANSHCWNDVINDWIQHEPNIVGTYPYACYTQAIQHLDQYRDIKGYSNAPEDIRRALYAAIHNNTGGSGPTDSSGGGGPSSGGGPGGSNDGGGSPPASSKGGPITQLFNSLGPGDAQSVPLPLLVLGGLAVLLMLAAAGTWLARRLQTRRMTPSPAPARRR
ncbi:MAG TPA: hypothetical protein VFJ91_12645 [Gaiellaceae bacterium]|nr:hypothetical protein [Gaiellaceae bacterium]